MTYGEFLLKWSGKGIDFDGAYGFQCMDLAHKYAVDVVGKDIPSAPAAKDVWDRATTGYTKIANTPDGVPQQGDIVIWGTAVGPYGHIAVFHTGDANSFVSFDQNWPVNSLCHLQNHNYKGVLGWLRPKPVVVPTPPTPTVPTITLSEEGWIRDTYQGLTGAQPTEDEVKYRISQHIPLRELIDEICSADQRFKDKWLVCPTPSLANFTLAELVKELLGRLKLG